MQEISSAASQAPAVGSYNTALKKDYQLSPKVIVLTGHPCAGKSTVSKNLVENCGYTLIALDAINIQIKEKLNIGAEELENPAVQAEYISALSTAFQKNRYTNIVTEGTKYLFPHVLAAVTTAIEQIYGDYTIVERFLLDTDVSIRKTRATARQLKFTEELLTEAVNGGSPAKIAHAQEQAARGFEKYSGVVPQELKLVENADDIYAWAESNKLSIHPSAPEQHKSLIADIANSQAFNPFYQSIEVDGELVLRGFTHTYRGFENLSKLGIDWVDKKVCEVGSNHGYYMFRIEEQGGSCTGYDICPGAIYVSNRVASERNSVSTFAVRDCCEQRFDQDFDVILAFSVMHRVSDFHAALENILNACKEVVFEVNLPEIDPILEAGGKKGFALVNRLSSRDGGAFGARDILHLKRR